MSNRLHDSYCGLAQIQFRLQFIYRTVSAPCGAIASAAEAPVGGYSQTAPSPTKGVSGEVSLLALCNSSWCVWVSLEKGRPPSNHLCRA